MPKKIKECTKAQLIAVDLPTHGDSYTVISHESVINFVYTELAAAGFGVVSETFRATADGQIAHGIHVLQYNSDPELSMMFAWTNSYNKQVRFKCGVGAYVNNAGTFMVHGDMGSWARKHTGTADEETVETIKGQIKDAQMYYDQLKSDKDAMKEIKMNKRKQAQLLGILFAEYQILTTEQASMVRSEMIKPTHVFEDSSSLWAFYNYVTTALQSSHPKTWMEDQRILHYFISSVNNFSTPQAGPQVQTVVEATVDPLTTNYGQPENQLNILTEIEKTEAEETSLELEENEAYLENPVNLDTLDEISNQVIEETVSYTDPAGNTFEAPIVIDSIELNKETRMSVMISPCAAHDLEADLFMDALDETVEEVISLEPTPEDHEQFEKEQLETEDDFAFDFSDEEDDDEAFF
jgi:hypothetical protein